MDQVGVFEHRIGMVARRAAKAAQVEVADAEAQTSPDHDERERSLLTRIGLTTDELDFVWTLAARAVEPRVAAYMKAIWGSEVRGGCSTRACVSR